MTSGCWFWGPSRIRVMAAVFIWYHVRCHFFQVTYGAFSKFGVRILPLIPSAKMIRSADLQISGVICYANNTRTANWNQKRSKTHSFVHHHGNFFGWTYNVLKNGTNMSNQHLVDIQDITWTFIHTDPSTPIWSYIWANRTRTANWKQTHILFLYIISWNTEKHRDASSEKDIVLKSMLCWEERSAHETLQGASLDQGSSCSISFYWVWAEVCLMLVNYVMILLFEVVTWIWLVNLRQTHGCNCEGLRFFSSLWHIYGDWGFETMELYKLHHWELAYNIPKKYLQHI